MRNHLLLLALSTSVVACSHSGLVGVDNFAALSAARVEVTAEGGIAALSIHHLVRHDDRVFAYAQRHICGQKCDAPLDSASGTLAPTTTDSLFTIVLSQSPFSLKDDYGPTPGSADMMTYTLTVTAGGNVKTIRADDGTMPAPMRQIIQAVQATVAAARK